MKNAAKTISCTLQIIVPGFGWLPITDPEQPMSRDECWERYQAVRGDYPAGTEFGIGQHNWQRDGDQWRMAPI